MYIFSYGKALNNFRFAYQCHVVIFTINGDNNQFGYLLECVSVCCLLIAKNWACVNQYVDEMNASNECIKKFLDIDCEACKKCKGNGNGEFYWLLLNSFTFIL